MYKQQIKNSVYIILFVLASFCLGFLSVQWWFIWDFLSEVNARLTDENYIKKISWKAIVSDLYYNSLEIVRTNEISWMENSIKLVIEYTKNKNFQCNLNRNDVLNILYNYNNDFRRSFKQNITNSYKTKPQYPSSEDYINSCYVFMWCFYWIAEYKDSPDIRRKCGSKVSDLYYQMYSNYDNISSFDQINFADDLFWNWKLEDADYDLLYDVEIIGKILFEGFKPPPQVLYYQFPDVSNLWDQNYYVPYSSDIDWFSPYNPSDFENDWLNNWTWANTLENSLFFWDEGDDIIEDLNPVFEYWTFDEDVKKFLASSQSINYWKNVDDNSNFLNWAICVTWFADGEYIDDGVMHESIKKYLNVLIEEIEKNKQDVSTSITPWWYSFVSWDLIDLSGDKQEIIDSIEDQIEMLSNVDDEQSQQAIYWCISKCDWLSVADKAVCIIKCTCTEFSSPSYSIDSFPVLKAWAFKIKFCMVPVQNKDFSKNGKIVYSIEEIYNEVYSILISLRDSGELLVSRKTKEFLESSVTKNKFAKIFSFSVGSSLKSLFSNPDLDTIKREEENFVKNIQKSVLCYWDNLYSPWESNKYLLMSNPISDISKNEMIESSSFNEIKCNWLDPIKLLQDDRLIKFDLLVFDFLKVHLAFWQDVIVMMNDINKTAESLSKK